MSVWDRRKQILYGSGSVGEVRQLTPLQSARSKALSAMAVEMSDLFYLFVCCLHLADILLCTFVCNWKHIALLNRVGCFVEKNWQRINERKRVM